MDGNPFDSFDSDTILISRNRKFQDLQDLSSILKSVKLKENHLNIGNFTLQGRSGISSPLQYSHETYQLLGENHNYSFDILDGVIELSLQLYENLNGHYRINSFSRCNGVEGQIFSMNLTTEKDAKGSIFFMRKIKFSERYKTSSDHAKKHRALKRDIFCNLLTRLGFEVTDNYDLLLGVYDTKTQSFLNTSPEKFIKDFLMISLLKGHFMGNKGYELETLPSYSLEQPSPIPTEPSEEMLPEKVKNQKTSRSIPLGLRFKVLERDRECKLCGRSPQSGVILHVDHIVPFSLGGLTTYENLQALCSDCNIGKSNRSITRY